MLQEFAPLESNEIFLEQIKANPELAGIRGAEQLRLINIFKEGRSVLKETGNEHDLRVRLGEQAIDLLLRENEGLVVNALKSRKIYFGDSNYDDARQVVLAGFVKGVEEFNPDHPSEASFVTYISTVMSREIVTKSTEIFGISRKKRNERGMVLGVIQQMQSNCLDVNVESISQQTGVKMDVVLNILNTRPKRINGSFIIDDDKEIDFEDGIVFDSGILLEDEVTLRLDLQKVLDPASQILEKDELRFVDLVLAGYSQEQIGEDLGGICQSGVSKLKSRVRRKITEALSEKKLSRIKKPDDMLRLKTCLDE
ncbi:MAG: sigma-70 family RNA polymerase sigma factor [Candidatus Shapirobacteria bacterium]|nr:sigma-70 family RNA polymerase sigma factor [Candidatus Shapirobacteria bacterium]